MRIYVLSWVCPGSGYSRIEEIAASHAEEARRLAEEKFGPFGECTYTTRKGK